MVARSRVSAEGLVTIPADVIKKLGIGPGSEIEWHEEDGKIVIRRAGKFTSEDIHKSLFGSSKPKLLSNEDLREGIRKYIRKKHGRS